MEEKINNILDSSNNSNNFYLLEDIKDFEYTNIKSYDININISDKLYSFNICKPKENNENKIEQIIFICKKIYNNEKNNIININNIENNKNDNDDINKIYYEGKYTLKQLILNNKFFNIFDSIEEVITEIIDLLDNNIEQNINIYFENNNFDKLFLKIKFPFLVKKNKDIILELFCKGINKKNINEYFYKEILLIQKTDDILEKEIEELKKQNEIINNRLYKLENLIEKENKNNKIEVYFNQIENKEMNTNIIDSYIINKKQYIDFLNNRLLQDKDVPKGKNVIYKLLYRSSKNGENSKTFHDLCDNYPQTLTVIKTTKGNIFGGYTEQTWKDTDINKRGLLKNDNKAFLFSINKKKIYNIYFEQPAIWCHESYGPCFYGKGNFTIYSKEKLLNGIMKTNKVKESTYIGMEKDFELTDGEQAFKALEIETFQILYA